MSQHLACQLPCKSFCLQPAGSADLELLSRAGRQRLGLAGFRGEGKSWWLGPKTKCRAGALPSRGGGAEGPSVAGRSHRSTGSRAELTLALPQLTLLRVLPCVPGSVTFVL